MRAEDVGRATALLVASTSALLVALMMALPVASSEALLSAAGTPDGVPAADANGAGAVVEVSPAELVAIAGADEERPYAGGSGW